MAVLPKRFLRIYDIADYLKSVNPSYEYDLLDSFDRNRLAEDVCDLVIHNGLKAVFKELTKDFKPAYFIAHDWQVKQILEREDIISVKGNHQIYCYDDGIRLTDIESELLNESSICFSDIYIPRAELDKLFQDDTQNDASQAIKQLEQSSQQQVQHQLSDRAEQSYLTTIGLLLELMTTPKGIENKAPFQSQSVIIGEIEDKGIYGQRKSSLETRFSEANQALNHAKKKG